MRGVPERRRVRLALLVAATAGACCAQLPFSNSSNYAAKVLSQSGQVSVLKDAQPWALSVGDGVEVRDLIITGFDGHALFSVSDGSTFEVFPNSRVVFRKNPPVWRDFLDVLMGKVRVHIEHMGITPNPNRVLTPTAVISVRGTTFEVSVSDDDEDTLVQVQDGQVEVEHAILPNGVPKLISAGESLTIRRNEPIAHNFDKGGFARRVLRSMHDAVIAVATRGPASGVGGVGGGAGGVGDKQKTPAPVPPPPPPGI